MAEPFTKEQVVRRWGHYHQLFARGLRQGRRVNDPGLSMAAVGWLLVYAQIAADDYLIFPADPDELLMDVAPRRARSGLTAEEVEGWLDEAEHVGLIARYTADNDQLYAVMLNAPPKSVANGKPAQHYPHPPAGVATLDRARRLWCPASPQQRATPDGCPPPPQQRPTTHATERNPENPNNPSHPRGPDDPSTKQAQRSSTQPSQPTTTSAGTAVAVVAPPVDPGGGGDSAAVLERCGVDVALVPDWLIDAATPNAIVQHWLAIPEGATNPAGMLVARLKRAEGLPPRNGVYTVNSLRKACKAGVATRIALGGEEKSLNGPVTWNSLGIYANGDLIVPAEHVSTVEVVA